MRHKQCRAICTVNQVNDKHGAEYRCEERASVNEEPALCWVHHKAYSNTNRTEPLRLVQEEEPAS